MAWDPEQYDKFKKERSAPVDDLFALLVHRPGLKVVDLGCGTAEHTRRLYDTLHNANVVGIDSSAEMLAKSTAFTCSGCSTRLQNIQDLGEDYDLVFSNAALHWCPNHKQLFTQLWQHLLPGGQLLIQMPKNQQHHSHLLASDCAYQLFPDRFPQLEHKGSSSVLEVADYAELLFDLGAQDIVVFQKVYPHLLQNADAVVEWVKGTLLLPILEKLNMDEQQRFMELYRSELQLRMPGSPVFYGFQRILLSARRL